MSALVARQWTRECRRTSDDIAGPSCLLAGMSRSRLLGVMGPCGVSTPSSCGATTPGVSSIEPMYTAETMLPIFGTFHDQVGRSRCF